MTATAIKLVANDNAHLLDLVHTLLTTHADLIAAGEEWVSMEYTAGESFIVKGVGLGGTDEIYIGWRVINTTGLDVYNIEIRGFGGYSAGAPWELQPITQTKSVYLCSYNLPFDYWVVANGRRFIVLERISTTYLSAYCGLYTPYATPTQVPYPLYIGASTYTESIRWSEVNNVAHALHPMSNSGNNAWTAWVYTNNGWEYVRSRSYINSSSPDNQSVFPFYDNTHRKDIRENIDGSYTVFSAILTDRVKKGVSGEFDGIGWVTGFQQNAENTITYTGETWIVMQDVHRNDIEDYYAVRLL